MVDLYFIIFLSAFTVLYRECAYRCFGGGYRGLKITVFTIVGFFAGFTNENTVIVFIVLYAGVILYKKAKKMWIPFWIYSSFVSLFLGALFMYMAPSTSIRIQVYLEMFGIEQVTFTDYLNRAENIIIRFFGENKAYIIITVILILIDTLLLVFKKEYKLELVLNENLLLLFLSSISCGALVMSPYVETRAFLLSDFFMLVCILFYVERIYILIADKRKKERIYFVVAMILSVIFLIEGIKIYKIYKEYWHFCTLREASIEMCEKDSVYVWRKYPYSVDARIMTTREDYIFGNDRQLCLYYGKQIKCFEE